MVADIPGGNAKVGTISLTGQYTAPKVTSSSTNVEIAAVDLTSMRTLVQSSVTIVEDPAVTEAHERWLAGVQAAAAEHGCKGELIQQQPNESVEETIKLYAQIANEHTCLVLQPVSTEPNSQRYSFSSGGEIDGVSILYISDVSQMRVWNGTEMVEN
jgi:hypothetical protein